MVPRAPASIVLRSKGGLFSTQMRNQAEFVRWDTREALDSAGFRVEFLLPSPSPSGFFGLTLPTPPPIEVNSPANYSQVPPGRRPCAESIRSTTPLPVDTPTAAKG